MNNIRSTLLYPFVACFFCCAPAAYSQPQVKQDILIAEALSGVEGKQGNLTRLEVPPGYKAATHSHPGETFVYVLSGRLLNQIGDAEPVIYEAGEFFFEEANAVHAQFENLDKENPAVFIIFGIRPLEGN